MPALPLDEAGKYVAGAYLVFLTLIVVYVAIIGAKISRIDRELGELVEMVDEPGGPVAVGDTIQRAYGHEGGMYFRDVIDNDGTVPIFSKVLGGFNFKSIVATDDLAPQAYRDYARTSLGVDAAGFLASSFMPVKGLGAALRGEVSMLEGRLGFTDIPRIIAESMDAHAPAPVSTLQAVRGIDEAARAYAGELIRRLPRP